MTIIACNASAVATARPPLIAAAGDIACATPCRAQRATARLVARLDPDAVLTLGDNQYDAGRLSEFRRSYDPTWGRFRGRTFPVPGNHEYMTSGAAGFFTYFGERTSRSGSYSTDLGRWHVVALNSKSGGRPDPRQVRWLRRDLRRDRHECELAYFHHPRWSSGRVHGPTRAMGRFWKVLYRQGVDVVLSGHEHHYERFARLTPWGRTSTSGIRQFVVGTGGAFSYGFGEPDRGSQRRVVAHGVLTMRLWNAAYQWRFVQSDGAILDAGHTSCHP
ncbi:hypothetical protein BH18ACT17_BH18ACT17_07350 [soil metagenome]